MRQEKEATKRPDFAGLKKLSDIAERSIDDMVAVQRSKKYELDMNYWHMPIPADDRCAVCMAGAVMANSLEGNSESHLEPGSFDYDTCKKLYAIDDFRTGSIGGAVLFMPYFRPLTAEQCEAAKAICELIRSNYDREIDRAPTRIYRRAIKMLRKVGL